MFDINKPLTTKDIKHYVGPELTTSIIEYNILCDKLENENKDVPKIPDNIGIAIQAICTRYAGSPNFKNYTFKDEMILEAIFDCVKAVRKFNPSAETRSGRAPTAFAFFTQIAYFSFCKCINDFKKSEYIKYKTLKQASMEASDDLDPTLSKNFNDNLEFQEKENNIQNNRYYREEMEKIQINRDKKKLKEETNKKQKPVILNTLQGFIE